MKNESWMNHTEIILRENNGHKNNLLLFYLYKVQKAKRTYGSRNQKRAIYGKKRRASDQAYQGIPRVLIVFRHELSVGCTGL